MKKKIIAGILLSALLLVSCGDEMTEISVPEISEGEIPDDLSAADITDMDFSFSDRDKNPEYTDEDIVSGNVSEGIYKITAEGTYILSGDMAETMVLVELADTEKAQIVLDNVDLSNSKGPAIYIKSADKVFLTAKDGTENIISDGEGYSYTDGDSDIDGAVFSRADLTINGKGKLTISGNTKHSVVSKDDLKILSVSLQVNSKNVGLNGKDCIKISDAHISLSAGSDGLRSDNDEDDTKGFVYMESGSLNISAGNDGIQAETIIKISDGDIDITAGRGSSQGLSGSEESYKGLKAESDIIINGGNINIDSTDDSIHSNNTITVTEGKLNLSSGDDGIHADTDISISGGEILITKSYEGIEAGRIFVTGGKIDLTASDDGINAAGGNDGSATTGGRPGMGEFSNGVGEIVISGGYMVVNASGDGLDSNGTFIITGGIVLVSGPTNSGNGAFDYDRGAAVTGGVLIALGSSGMAAGFTQAENQGAILYSFSSQSAGTSFAVCDSDGKVIASFTPGKAYNSAVVTAPGLKQGETYTFVCGGTVADADGYGYASGSDISGGTTVATISLSELIYNSGGGGMGGPGGGMGKPNGGMGGRPR